MILDQQAAPINLYPAHDVALDYTGYAYQDQYPLPEGCWLLSVVKGDAWLFQNGEDTVLHTGEQVEIYNQQGDIHIRSLYARGVVKFTLVAIEEK